MISRKLIAALVGLTLVAGTTADASTMTGKVASKSVTTTATKPVAATTVRPVGKIAGKHHRIHVSHRALKRMKIAKLTAGKRLALSHATKRVAQKHA